MSSPSEPSAGTATDAPIELLRALNDEIVWLKSALAERDEKIEALRAENRRLLRHAGAADDPGF